MGDIILYIEEYYRFIIVRDFAKPEKARRGGEDRQFFLEVGNSIEVQTRSGGLATYSVKAIEPIAGHPIKKVTFGSSRGQEVFVEIVFDA